MLHFGASKNQNAPINDTPYRILDTLILNRFRAIKVIKEGEWYTIQPEVMADPAIA